MGFRRFIGCCTSVTAAPSGGGGGGGGSPGTYTAYPTGTDGGGGVDAHYSLVGEGDPTGTLTAHDVPTHSGWTDQAGASWISPSADTSTLGPGPYDYSTTVTIDSGTDISSLVIQVSVMADNFLDDVLINGTSAGIDTTGVTYTAPVTLTLPNGLFNHGSNTVTFVVRDSGLITGLNVKWLT